MCLSQRVLRTIAGTRVFCGDMPKPQGPRLPAAGLHVTATLLPGPQLQTTASWRRVGGPLIRGCAKFFSVRASLGQCFLYRSRSRAATGRHPLGPAGLILGMQGPCDPTATLPTLLLNPEQVLVNLNGESQPGRALHKLSVLLTRGLSHHGPVVAGGKSHCPDVDHSAAAMEVAVGGPSPQASCVTQWLQKGDGSP